MCYLQQVSVALTWTAVTNAVDYTVKLYQQASAPVTGDTVRIISPYACISCDIAAAVLGLAMQSLVQKCQGCSVLLMLACIHSLNGLQHPADRSI